ncbi:FxsA family protein [Allocatelliglobosispora scoriae]|uniref:FxsA family protein n=1 Tax=Allocatelliglobosispora scoriae TaxID=643052 RepID=UPI0035E463EB
MTGGSAATTSARPASAAPKRGRLRYVPLIALVVFLAELAVFVAVSRWIGVGWAVLAGLAFTLLGAYLLKREGVKSWRRFRESAKQGVPAGNQVLDGVVGLGAALLLFVPGFLTGIAGLALLIPPVRRLASGRLRGATEKRVSSRTAGDLFGPRQVKVQRPTKASTTPSNDEVVEGEIVD